MQKSLSTSVKEERFVRNLVEKKIQCSRIATGELSSIPTVGGNGNEFTHRFNVNVILDSNVTDPSDYICRTLRRGSFQYDRGRRIFFRLGDFDIT